VKTTPESEPTKANDDLLTEVQARQQELPMSLGWYRRMRLLGGGPVFVRISNRIFYRRSALRAFVAQREAR
jgi:hypothetical protein